MTRDLHHLKAANKRNAMKVMKKADLDAMLVTTIDNVRYLTGERLYMEFDWYVDAYSAILTSAGDIVSLTAYYGKGCELRSFPFIPPPLIAQKWAKIFANTIEDLGLVKGRIGIDHMYFETLHELKKAVPSTVFCPILKELLNVRAVKNRYEIEIEREAARIVDLGLETGYELSKEGTTENEVFASMLKVMTEAGSEGPPFFSLCSSGKRTLHHMLSTNKKLRDGDAVWFDIGCVFNGYVGDGARTSVVGTPTKEVKELYSTIYEAHTQGIKKTKPGIKASEIDRTIREYLLEAGYPDYPHSSGHGIGLKVTELPWITSKNDAGHLDMDLKAGMIFGLEPKTFSADIAAAGLEDMILVTETGYEVLTKARYLEALLPH